MKDTDAALIWILEKLQRHEIPFRITGGFAARLYGAARELADIDIELSERHYETILPEIQPYIVWGPGFYTDDNWKLNLITLRYAGQEIDLAGVEETEIFDQTKKEWVPLVADFSTNREIKYNDVLLPVIPKEELLTYKAKLLRAVDQQDVEALS